MFLAAQFVILPNWKPAKHSSTVEWVNLAYSIMEYYTAIKVNDLQLHTTIKMSLTHT